MRAFTRIVSIALIASLILLTAGAGAALFLTRQPFPKISGTVSLAATGAMQAQLSGLSGPVEIVRDRFGVPHIYADTPEDLFRAQGFVHAQDRYFQMEFWRRIGQGRLAELFGAGALDQDRFIRTLGWHRVAAQEAQLLDPEIRRYLESYAAGVNSYALNNADALGLEFRVLGLIGRRWAPEQWLPENSLTWGKAMAFNLGSNMDYELLRLALAERGGQALIDAVAPPYPANAPFIVTAGPGGAAPPRAVTAGVPAGSAAAALALLRASRGTAAATGLLHDREVGSNNWVIAGARTATGKPLLANDPHLGIQMPSIWYQVGLHCRTVGPACPFDVVGASFAGTPGVVLGHNGRIAWGVTNTAPDVQDVFIETPDPANSDAFLFRGQSVPAEVREEKIAVAGQAEPVTLRVRVSRHGPILNDVIDQLKNAPPMALQWTALTPGTLFKSVIEINKAQNWQQFRDALRYWSEPSQNFVYADVDGNIGYQMPGRVPIRASGDGRMPVDGASGAHDWIGEIPFDELPFAFNPPEGYIITANNAVVDPAIYPHVLTTDWDYGYRARRIAQMIDSAEAPLTVADMGRMQFDAHSVFADDVMPYFDALGASDPVAQAALDAMRAWDRASTRASTGAAVFEVFAVKLSHAIFEDEVGADLAKESLGAGSHAKTAVHNMLADPAAPWWDDVTTPERETREQIIARAFGQAVDELKTRLGDDVRAWQWGKLHTVVFPNQTLGTSGIEPVEAIFNRGPFAAEGAPSAVNNTGGPSFTVTSGPSWRAVFDLADLRNSLGIHTTGQSGHAYNGHYDDMIPLWLEGRHNPLLWAREDVLANAEATLTLSP